jgi:hypothetical protein
MSELIKALGRFVARDLIYVIGGATVILSFLYLFNRLSSDELPLAYSLFGAGLAYVVGYTIQDTWCLMRVVTMADYFEPNRFVRWLYLRFTREEWHPIERFDTYRAHRALYARETEKENLAVFERVVSLRQVSATMGPCALVSAFFLFVRVFSFCQASSRCFDFWLAIFAATLGVGLVCLSWLKGAQQVMWLHILQDARRNRGDDA